MRNEILKKLTDEQLAIRFQAEGDGMAFGELYQRHYSKLYHYCFTIVHDTDEAADLTQDTFARAAEKIQDLKAPALFASWLFRIAHNRCIDKAKDRQRHQTVAVDGPYQLADEVFDIEEALAREAAIEQITTLIQQLSPESRTILLAKYFEGRSIHELTQLWGISESAVKMRLARARNRVFSLYKRKRVAS
ncbi:MAG: RNA polymerase sigma factor [Phaeodactylibacter sp.]|nr:RNA polymerase sigma factor [Phaeodactylibacter sp.]MCB9265416.1 RNA polymerase sigma factor [Lewinellaceae bacterium]